MIHLLLKKNELAFKGFCVFSSCFFFFVINKLTEKHSSNEININIVFFLKVVDTGLRPSHLDNM
jgi:hypothetical protein